MASINLRDVWMHLHSDPTKELRFDIRGSEAHEVAKPGRVSRYANGRRRAVTRRGLDEQLELRLTAVTREQLETINEWLGQTVVVRDPVGRIFTGTYFRAPAEELYPRDLIAVSLTIESITVDLVV